jgi:hypothetical protein
VRDAVFPTTRVTPIAGTDVSATPTQHAATLVRLLAFLSVGALLDPLRPITYDRCDGCRMTELARGRVSDRPWGMTLGTLGIRGLTGIGSRTAR